jgi:predicted nucleotidyltransferase
MPKTLNPQLPPEVRTNMERQIDDKLIGEITEKIVEAFHPRRVILFGSRARGDHHSDSDIDLFIEMESNEPRWKRRVEIGKLFLHRWWSMDIITYTPKEVEERKDSFATIVPRVLQEGRVLYHA